MPAPTEEEMESAYVKLLGGPPGILLAVWREDWPSGALEGKAFGEDPDAEEQIWKTQPTHVRFFREGHMNPKNIVGSGPEVDLLRARMGRWTADLIAAGFSALVEKWRKLKEQETAPVRVHE